MQFKNVLIEKGNINQSHRLTKTQHNVIVVL